MLKFEISREWLDRHLKDLDEAGIEEPGIIGGGCYEDFVQMLIKNGSILLTDEDMKEYREGQVSERIRQTWGLSFDELKHLIENNNYEDINDVSSTE